ncbi:MAG: S41 family peptidase [Alphaproteobacteria bacterium]
MNLRKCATLAAALAGAALSLAAAPQFDPKPWLDDLRQARAAFAEKYANLEWAVFDRELDLPQLFATAQHRIETAASDADARAAFERLAARLSDDHVDFRWPAPAAKASNPTGERCAALGFDAHMAAAPLAALAPGYRPLAHAAASEFPAGMIVSGGRHVGVLKLGVFDPAGYPELCQAALQALAIPATAPCDDACQDRVMSWAAARMTRDFAAQLRALQTAGAAVLVVDIAGNGGGTQWAEAAARMLTPIRLRSESMRFIRGDHWVKNFADEETELRKAVADNPVDAAFLNPLIAQLTARQKEAATPCSSEPFWHGARPACSWLGEGFYGSGILPWADPATLRGKPWAAAVFSPMQFLYEEGVWRGPLVVLIDADVASAASEFSAVLQDNHAALIMGAPSSGGCGHTNGGTPTVLTNSHAVLSVPDCARIRADGSNETRGIEPDVLVGFSAKEGGHLRAQRFVARLPAAVSQARELLQRLRLEGGRTRP